MNKSVDKAAFFRALGDFYAAHTNLEWPTLYSWGDVTIYLDKETAKDDLRAIGGFDKDFQGDYFVAKKEIGGVKVDFKVDREAVCERVVTGKKYVEGHIIPAVAEQYIPGHEEDVVEWHCPESVLAPKETECPAQPNQ